MPRMPVRAIVCGVAAPRISTFISAAVFAAASQPSMSKDGSASAMPAACISRRASSNVRPASIAVST